MKNISAHALRKNIEKSIDHKSWSPSEWKRCFDIMIPTHSETASIVRCHYEEIKRP